MNAHSWQELLLISSKSCLSLGTGMTFEPRNALRVANRLRGPSCLDLRATSWLGMVVSGQMAYSFKPVRKIQKSKNWSLTPWSVQAVATDSKADGVSKPLLGLADIRWAKPKRGFEFPSALKTVWVNDWIIPQCQTHYYIWYEYVVYRFISTFHLFDI